MGDRTTIFRSADDAFVSTFCCRCEECDGGGGGVIGLFVNVMVGRRGCGPSE